MKNNRAIKIIVWICMVIMILPSCKKYLDIIPDNVATIDYAFRNRNEAEKYLFTCYNYLPSMADVVGNPGILGGDEFTVDYPGAFTFTDINPTVYGIPMGLQTKVNPISNFWDGGNGGKPYFQAIRECNIFFENVDKIVDLKPTEKKRWVAEIKFLKAYYHYWLFRMYGPVPLIKVNLPISSSVNDVKLHREPVDSVVKYIAELIDEATPDLPDVLINQTSELGRITQSIALSIKAELLTTAASPLFNGNSDYVNFADNRGIKLFPAFSADKWKQAAIACKAAIDACTAVGCKLFYFTQQGAFSISDSTRTLLNIQAGFTQKWNTEIIWGATNSMATGGTRDLQSNSQPMLSPVGYNSSVGQNLAVPLNMTELFYSNNGVPINEDISYDYPGRFTRLRTVTDGYRYYLKKDYITAQINFDREPRYYADLAFDGSLWYGGGQLDDNKPYYVQSKLGQTAGAGTTTNFSKSGLWPRKLVNYANSYATNNSYSVEPYPWPMMRLGELYLLYAESLNESNGPSGEVYSLLDQIRTRAGLKGVVESWAAYSNNPSKPASKQGLREIIQRERMIETAFEGKRLWDIRRWKQADIYLNQIIKGWTITESASQDYYRVKQLYSLSFSSRDYFWPISENSIIVNSNLVQNPGW